MRLITNEELFFVVGGDSKNMIEPEAISSVNVEDIASMLGGIGGDYSVADSYEVLGQTVYITGSGAEGFQTAISDCANGAEVGGVIGFFTPVGPAAGAALGCLVNTAVGIFITANK